MTAAGPGVAGVTLVRRCPADAATLFRVVADVAHHDAYIPLTTTVTDPGPPQVGWRFVATTRLGPLRLADPMVVTTWSPPADSRSPGAFAIAKTGRVLAGWARAEVRPLPDGGSEVTWAERIRPASPRLARLPGLDRAADLATRALFGRALARMVAQAQEQAQEQAGR